MESDYVQPPKNPEGIAGAPLRPIIKSDKQAFDAFQANNATPIPVPKEDFGETTKMLHNNSPLQTLRTYESDIAEIVKKKDTSIVKIAVKQQEHTQKLVDEGKIERPDTRKEDPKMGAYFLGISGILIIAGLAVIAGLAYVWVNRTPKAPPIKVDAQEVIITEKSEEIIVSSTQNVLDILRDKKASVTGNARSLAKIVFAEEITKEEEVVKQPLDAETFAARLGTSMPAGLIRSFGQYYTTGFQINESENDFFAIIKIESFENAYAGMLEWEKTLLTDLKPLLSESANVPATTSPRLSTSTLRTMFGDQVISNEDVRIAKNTQGTPVLYYSFPDRQTLVITTSESTLTELFARIITSQFVQ